MNPLHKPSCCCYFMTADHNLLNLLMLADIWGIIWIWGSKCGIRKLLSVPQLIAIRPATRSVSLTDHQRTPTCWVSAPDYICRSREQLETMIKCDGKILQVPSWPWASNVASEAAQQRLLESHRKWFPSSQRREAQCIITERSWKETLALWQMLKHLSFMF